MSRTAFVQFSHSRKSVALLRGTRMSPGSHPDSASFLTTYVPKKPAPPVTRILFLARSNYSLLDESTRFHNAKHAILILWSRAFELDVMRTCGRDMLSRVHATRPPLVLRRNPSRTSPVRRVLVRRRNMLFPFQRQSNRPPRRFYRSRLETRSQPPQMYVCSPCTQHRCLHAHSIRSSRR